MRKICIKIIYTIILLLAFCFGYFNNYVYTLYCKILQNNDLVVLFGTLIAGLFGFIVAVIPLAISLFKQENDFIKRLLQKDNFESFIKPLLNRFVSCLLVMFYFFIFLLFLSIVKDFIFEHYAKLDFFAKYFNEKKIIVSILAIFYIYFIIKFLNHIRIIIRDLQTLVYIFLQSNNKN